MAGHPREYYERWVADNGGIEALREAVDAGRFGEGNIRGARSFLDQHDRAERDARQAGADADAKRGVDAAVSQATTARNTFWLAVAAFVVSLVAIGLTVYDLATRH